MCVTERGVFAGLWGRWGGGCVTDRQCVCEREREQYTHFRMLEG